MTFEEYLQEIHAKNYTGIGDEMYDRFDTWIVQLNVDAIIAFAEMWHKSELSKRGTQGGKARADSLTPERRKEIARMGGLAKRAAAVWLRKTLQK